MNKTVSIAMLVAGSLLTIFGIGASKSFSSDISRFFTGAPTDKAIWLLVGGIVVAAIGVVGLWRGSKTA